MQDKQIFYYKIQKVFCPRKEIMSYDIRHPDLAEQGTGRLIRGSQGIPVTPFFGMTCRG